MIIGFGNKETQSLWLTGKSRKLNPNILRAARRKLTILNAAHVLDDLKAPPGNHLEPLTGDRLGQHSIRINDQWRICFIWTLSGPDQVEIVDYHN